MVANYVTFSPTSKDRIIACCFYPSPLISYLKPEYFDTASEASLVGFLLKYRADYKAPPIWDEVYAQFQANNAITDLLHQIKPLLSDFDLALLEQHAAEFIKYKISATYRETMDACTGVLGGAEADGYLWNLNFRKRIIALSLQKDWFTRYGTEVVKPEYFDSREEQALVKFIAKFYKDYRRSPEPDELLSEFDQATDPLFDLACDVLKLMDTDLRFASAKSVEFAQQQAMKLAILNSVEDINANQLSKPLERVKDALRVGMDAQDLGIDLVEDKATWLYGVITYDENRVSTGIEHLDMAMHGGLGRGEYGIVAGPSNSGKSRTLINIGVGAASLISKAKVTHITTEMSKEQVAKRYAARLTGHFLKPDMDVSVYEEEFDQSVNIRLRGSIKIKQYPTGRLSLEQLEAYLDLLELNGYKTDMLIVDDPDLMYWNPKMEKRHGVAYIAKGLRALGIDRYISVWGSSQTTRDTLYTELLGLDDLAESWEKAGIADVVVMNCQTREEHADNRVRLHGAKFRDEGKLWTVGCVIDQASQALVSTEIITASEWMQIKAEKAGKQLEVNAYANGR